MVQQNYDYNARVINVVDGDTVDATIDLGFYIYTEQRMRLVGIDTKELNSQDEAERELAKSAKQRLIELVLNKAVIIKSYKKDKYGRFLAEVFLPDGRCVNSILLAEGLAVPYDGGQRG